MIFCTFSIGLIILSKTFSNIYSIIAVYFNFHSKLLNWFGVSVNMIEDNIHINENYGSQQTYVVKRWLSFYRWSIWREFVRCANLILEASNTGIYFYFCGAVIFFNGRVDYISCYNSFCEFWFRYPINPMLRKQWINFAVSHGFEPNTSGLVCEYHFDPTKDYNIMRTRKKLNKNAVPSILLVSVHTSVFVRVLRNHCNNAIVWSTYGRVNIFFVFFFCRHCIPLF